MPHPSKPVPVDIVSDVVCPWCVIGYYQLAAAARETGVPIEVRWHPFELNPNMADEGENLRDHLAAKYGTTLENSIKSRARLTELGADLGFEFNYADDMRIVNTFRAHQLIDWAALHGKAHETNLALFSAFFTHRCDVSVIEVLGDVAASVGLSRDEAIAMLQSGKRADAVREEERHWTSRGVSGVPTMIFDERFATSGAQGVENFSDALLRASQAATAESNE